LENPSTTAMNNRLAIARLLLEHGADPHEEPIAGKTAISIAKDRGQKQFIDLLKEFGAISDDDPHPAKRIKVE
jgi:ankyrin repeat protein